MGINRIIAKTSFLNSKYSSVIFVALVLLISALMLFFYKTFTFEEKKPIVDITLIGDSDISVDVGSIYKDQGFKFIVDDQELQLEELDYEIIDNVDVNVLGDYNISYRIAYDDQTYNVVRNIKVVDNEAPVITLNTDKVQLYYCKKENNNNLEYSAIDNYDGVLTLNVKEEIKENVITLSVSDSAGNLTSLDVPYVVTETPSSKIELNGNKLIYVPAGTKYVDPGAKATNGCGKNINSEIKITNTVDITTPGKYSVVYEIDDDGSVIKKERTVVVYNYVERITNPVGNNKKVVYLTFDDGPGRYTREILDLLDKYDAKATFFVTNQFKDYVPLIKEEYKRGHTVAVHTLTHKWSIYSSVENYMKDFYDMTNIIKSYTGSEVKIWRLPGGGSNGVSKRYATGVVKAVISNLSARGYVYFDWNVDSNDAGGANKNKVVENVINGMKKKNVSVVLMHDIKKATRDGLEEILKYGSENGYVFKALDEKSPTVHHGIGN